MAAQRRPRWRVRIASALLVLAGAGAAVTLHSWTYAPDGGRLRLDFAIILRAVALGDRSTVPAFTPTMRRRANAVVTWTQDLDDGVTGVTARDLRIQGPAGEALPLRIYEPERGGAGAPLPVVVFYHGGGWIFGSIETHDNLCRYLARDTGAMVVSVDYRLAPEHPFPAGFEDAYTALLWVHANAAAMGADPKRLAVAGDSAGGNLAAAVALRARDTRGPRIAFQALIYPALDLASFDTPSHVMLSTAKLGLRAADLGVARRWYIPASVDPANPYVSPLRAPDVSRLPPALVVTAQYDSLRDEGEAWAERLRAAGIDAKASRYSGMIHGFVSMHRQATESAVALAELASALRTALAVNAPRP